MANKISSDGKGLEKLVSRIYETLKDNPLTEVRHNIKLDNTIEGKSQFDVLIKSQVAGLNILIAVECKDYKGAVSISEIHDFGGRCNLVKGINKKVFVAVNGYQSGAIGAAQHYDIDLYDLKEVSAELVYSWIDARHIWGTYFNNRRFNVINFYTPTGKILTYTKATLDPHTPVIDVGQPPTTINELIHEFAQNEEITKEHCDIVFEQFKALPLRGDEKEVIVIFPVLIDLDGEPFIIIPDSKPVEVNTIEILTEYVFTVARSTDAVARSYENGQKEGAAMVLSCKVGIMNLEVIRIASSGQTKFFATNPSGRTIEVKAK